MRMRKSLVVNIAYAIYSASVMSAAVAAVPMIYVLGPIGFVPLGMILLIVTMYLLWKGLEVAVGMLKPKAIVHVVPEEDDDLEVLE